MTETEVSVTLALTGFPNAVRVPLASDRPRRGCVCRRRIQPQCRTVNSDDANASGWSDPITYMHNGDPSWYFGPLFGFDVGHLIGSDPVGAHIDSFGPLNPLHYLIQMPAMLFPGGPLGYATCSISGGCN
jgi:hypothetical protein